MLAIETIPSVIDPQSKIPGKRSMNVISQMLNLEELTLFGLIVTDIYFEEVLSCQPNLKLVDIGLFGWFPVTKVILDSPKCERVLQLMP